VQRQEMAAIAIALRDMAQYFIWRGLMGGAVIDKWGWIAEAR